jgi:hypothetical protein
MRRRRPLSTNNRTPPPDGATAPSCLTTQNVHWTAVGAHRQFRVQPLGLIRDSRCLIIKQKKPRFTGVFRAPSRKSADFQKVRGKRRNARSSIRDSAPRSKLLSLLTGARSASAGSDSSAHGAAHSHQAGRPRDWPCKPNSSLPRLLSSSVPGARSTGAAAAAQGVAPGRAAASSLRRQGVGSRKEPL